MSRSGRLSLGGNALRDSNHRLNIRNSSSITNSPSINKRRVSFGGSLSTYNSNDFSCGSNNMNEPKKDRRAMLEEWRAQRAKENGGNNGVLLSGSGNGGGLCSLSIQQDHDKENRQENHVASMVPSSSSSTAIPSLPLPPSVEGTTAVERFRNRRLQRERRVLGDDSMSNNNNNSMQPLPPLPPSDRSIMTTTSTSAVVVEPSNESFSSSKVICFDDDPVPSLSNGRGRSTPSINRRMTLSGGARRRVTKGRKSTILPPSNFNHDGTLLVQIVFTSLCSFSLCLIRYNKMLIFFIPKAADNETQSTAVETIETSDTIITGNTSMNNSIDQSVENDGEINEPGLRSRVILMEKRIQDLEKEKLSLSMSKAPLEARLRQKEDQWTKEQSKYEHEISSLMNSSKESNDRLKGVEMELEALQEENRKLKFEARKQNYIDATEQSGSNDAWSRQIQNDRDVAEYREKLHAAEEEIKALRLEKVSIESEVNATSMEFSALVREFDGLQEEYEDLIAKKEANAEAEIQLEELKKEHTATTALLNATSGELASLKSQSKFDMEIKEKEWSDEKDKLLFDISVLKSRAATNDYENTSSDEEDEAVLKARIEERDRRIAQLEAEVLKGELVRREMHNRIQELRGNIRVYVRTRPFLPGDNGETTSSIELLPDGESLSIEGQKSKTHDFKFDKIFAPSAGQESVFDEVSEFVQSALDGYHVCLFSYGQTGSGKTHTMQGSGNGAMRGIIPRAVEQILDQAQKMKEQKWSFNVTASFLEIYNEELKDLLVAMNDERKSNSNDSVKLAIKREKNGKSYVSNLTKIAIDTEEIEEGIRGLKAVMASAARSRSVACTKMNSVSSRSHSVFMLHLSGVNEESGTMVQGALNLCDLAGSERLDRSGAGSNAQRLKETQSINKSLSCLGDVFSALSNGSSHIPFRNSKLTYLLQDCLSGDGKALMFVNLSPTLTSSNESLCSLRFAQRVNQVELGKATKHVQYRSGNR